MTQDIIEMAQECKLIGMRPHLDGIYSESLVAFAKLVAAKAFQNGYEKGVAAFTEAVNLEREACAKVCAEYAAANTSWTKAAVKDCAAIIKARGET
jgi:hypothetical protein